jgi:PKHD-type hydroxylase
MLITIPAILSRKQIGDYRRQLDEVGWQDGKLTAGPQSGKVKHNEQADAADPMTRRLVDRLLRALERHPLFLSAALPRHVFPPIFSRYGVGMGFGAHVDNAIRQLPGTALRLRTDLSATLYLSDPDEYDGGELEIEDHYGVQTVKLAAGDLVLYPSDSLHRVQPVTRGARVCAIIWLQSMVRDNGARTLLFDMDQAVQALGPLAPDHPALLRLTACYHNLMRRWAEL